VGRFVSISLLLGQFRDPRTSFACIDQLFFFATDQLEVFFPDPQSSSYVPAAASTTSSPRWRILALPPDLMRAGLCPLLAPAC
jgi:hypothetical protein